MIYVTMVSTQTAFDWFAELGSITGQKLSVLHVTLGTVMIFTKFEVDQPIHS